MVSRMRNSDFPVEITLRQLFESPTVAGIAELIDGGLSSHLWESSAHDMRTYLAKTDRDVEEHAKQEQELLLSLRRQLVKEL